MLIYKLLQTFLLPSTFLLGFLIAGLVLIWRKKKKLGMILLLVATVGYYAFSITPVSNVLLEPLENRFNYVRESQLKNADTVVVLLGGESDSQIRAGEVLRIYNLKEKKPQVVISGSGALKKVNLADKLKNYLIERGIEKENIIVEDSSRTTFENAENVSDLVEKEPFFLVTSALHMPRALISFKHFKADPIPTPSNFRVETNYTVLNFFPSSYNLSSADKTFHEYFGIIYYRFFHF